VAGTRNQAHLTAQLRLRRQLGQHDRLVAAFFRADAAVGRTQRRIEAIRATYAQRLNSAEGARDLAVGARREVLAAVALELGDERAADVLELPVSRVRAARRGVGAERARRAGSQAPPGSDGRDLGDQSHSDAAADGPGHAGRAAGQIRSAMSSSTLTDDGAVEIGVP
jgi:hypothetical protein